MGGPDSRFNYLGQDMAVKDIPIEVGWFPSGRYVTFPGEAGWFVSFYGVVEWWHWLFIVIGILIFLIDGFSAPRRFKRGEYGWYRSGWDGANAKAHCFLFTGERVPRISFKRYYSFCRRRYLHSSWERIEDPRPDIMCSKCMDYIRRKSLWPGWLPRARIILRKLKIY